MTLVEDAGYFSLEKIIKGRTNKSILKTYESVIDNILKLHIDATSLFSKIRHPFRLQPAFTSKLYIWEHELFFHNFAASCDGLSETLLKGVSRDLRRVSSQLIKEHRVLLHRDLQSSNILFHRNEPVFIDFQGMRFGPAAYDLASLLCDPYVFLDEPLQKELIELYAHKTESDVSRLERLFWLASVQRLIQTLGAFARLSSESSTSRFGAYISPALSMLRRAAGHVKDLRHVDEMLQILDKANCHK